MKKLSHDYTRILVIHPDIIQNRVVFDPSRLSRDYTRVAAQGEEVLPLSPDFTRVAAQGEEPPSLGIVSEKIRTTLSKEYGVYPPNLSTAISGDTIVITAVSQQTGLNLQITLKNLAADLVIPGSGNTENRIPGVIPAGGQGTPPAAPVPGGASPAPGGAPMATPGAVSPGV